MGKREEKNKRYTDEFKEKIAIMRQEGKSLDFLCREYDIPQKIMIKRWVKKYEEAGIKGFEDKRGKTRLAKTQLHKNMTIQEEIECLKVENEYLKKKLLIMGESVTFIANLWSSKNRK